MVQVVDYEEFSLLKREFEVLKEDNQFLRSLLLGERWLTRKQAMVALGCKDDKLRQLTLNNTLTYRYEGKTPSYDVFSIRSYLLARKIESTEVDKKVLFAKLSL